MAGVFTKKSLGQHFLKCTWVANTLIKSAEISKNDVVLEIGPGTGILTRELARHAGSVVAIEKDEALADVLQKKLAQEGFKNVEIIRGDILRWQIPFKNSYKVVANIPYYLTSRLIKNLLEEENPPECIALTIQKEVAERIVARPPRMNLLGLSVQAYGHPKIVKTVPANCFSPAPKVDSAILLITDISERFFEENRLEKAQFFGILRQAFTLKRKTILNALGKAVSKSAREAALHATEIDPNRRPQELTP